jgi:copper chaperone NosL
MQRTFRSLAIFFVLGLAACAANLGPVDIENGDMCSFCRMAISEKQFVAEIILADETVLKFDDIGCMLRYQKAKPSADKPSVIYVVDSETRQWLKTDDAYFIRSQTVKTPMGSGIIAFASATSAGDAALRFSDLQER